MTQERITSECVCCGSKSLEKSPAVIMPFIAKRAFDWNPIEITEAWGLRDLKPGHAYALCNSLLCTNCQLLFLDIRFSDAELALIYNGYFTEPYIQQRDFYEPGFAARAKFLVGTHPGILEKVERFISEHITAPSRILDWGGGSGSNTPFIGRCKEVDIYEISDVPLVPGAKKVTPEQTLGKQYDLIVSRHVLEHVPYPCDSLAEMVSRMTAASYLYVEVPHEALVRTQPDLKARLINKRHWHEHINFYTEEALKTLYNRSGLEVVEIKSIQTHETIWSFCCLSKLQP